MAAATAFVGIDVSKAALDACLLRPDGRAGRAAFANDAGGHAALIAWADRRAGGAALHFCLEATGPYSEGPAAALADAGRPVSVANPARVKAHAAAAGRGNKTDAADARAVALFARDRRPPAWRSPPRKSGNCRAWCGGATTCARWPREKPRLDSPALTRAARLSVGRAVRFLGREADRMQAEADALIAAAPGLRADRDLLESIPGVGRQTASTVLAELPPVGRLPSAESAAAAAGRPRASSARGRACASAPAFPRRAPRAAALGAVPAGPDRHPLQPRPQGLLRAADGRGQAEDAGGRGAHAQAADALLRGAQEPRPLRPPVGPKKCSLTTRYLVRRALPRAAPAAARRTRAEQVINARRIVTAVVP